jgi:hypothetical protein
MNVLLIRNLVQNRQSSATLKPLQNTVSFAQIIRAIMFQQPASTVDSEDSLLDISTAPTTPDGSLTFSPVLQALKLQDALEEASGRRYSQRSGSGSMDATLLSNGGGLYGVKNICCIGAGYVGELHNCLVSQSKQDQKFKV